MSITKEDATLLDDSQQEVESAMLLIDRVKETLDKVKSNTLVTVSIPNEKGERTIPLSKLVGELSNLAIQARELLYSIDLWLDEKGLRLYTES